MANCVKIFCAQNVMNGLFYLVKVEKVSSYNKVCDQCDRVMLASFSFLSILIRAQF